MVASAYRSGSSPRGGACQCGGVRADLPSRPAGPGAIDAGVVIYIDRQLAGPYGRDRYRYTKPPFGASSPEHGYQGKETRETYRAGSRAGRLRHPVDLRTERQASRDREDAFFGCSGAHDRRDVLRPDARRQRPPPGGRWSGSRPADEITASIWMSTWRTWRPAPKSLEQVTGHRCRPWEDEK